MSVDMSPDAVAARLARVQPPDLLPEHRLDHKIDMSGEAIERRLNQVEELRRLSGFLTSIGQALRDAP